MKPQKIEISYRTIVFTVLFLCGLVLLWSLRSLIFIFFVCFMLMEALNPTIKRFERLKLPRPVAILIIYVLLISIIAFTISEVVPILVEQTSGLVRDLPFILQNYKIFGFQLSQLSSQFRLIETLPSDIARTVFSLFSNLISGFVILVVTFYLLLERKHFNSYCLRFFGEKSEVKIMKIVDTLESRLSQWVNGMLILMTIIGVLSYLGYLVIGLKYAVPLALMAGLFEIIPNIGPVFTTILAGLVGLASSPIMGLTAVIWGLFVHQAENNLITPKIMKEAVGLNPIITIFTIAAGAELGGIAGALLAVPVYLTIETSVRVLMEKNNS